MSHKSPQTCSILRAGGRITFAAANCQVRYPEPARGPRRGRIQVVPLIRRDVAQLDMWRLALAGGGWEQSRGVHLAYIAGCWPAAQPPPPRSLVACFCAPVGGARRRHGHHPTPTPPPPSPPIPIEDQSQGSLAIYPTSEPCGVPEQSRDFLSSRYLQKVLHGGNTGNRGTGYGAASSDPASEPRYWPAE